jgi:hypothetical protein
MLERIPKWKKDRILEVHRKEPDLQEWALAERFGVSISSIVVLLRKAGIKRPVGRPKGVARGMF